MKKGFDNDKYLAMQSEHIRERIQQFDNKLYLEFGGKLYDDYHASVYFRDLSQTANCVCSCSWQIR